MRHKFSHYTFKKSSIRHKTPGYNQDDLYLFYYQLKGYICLCFWFKSTTCWKGRHGLWTVDAWFATNSWLESWSWRWFRDIVIFFGIDASWNCTFPSDLHEVHSLWFGALVEVICRKTGENEVPPEMTSQLTMSLKCKTSHFFPKIWKEGEIIVVTGGNSTKQQYSRTHPRGGGRTGCPSPPWWLWGPHRRRLAGVHFRWGLRTGFRTQQNTPSSPSRSPLSRAIRAIWCNGAPEDWWEPEWRANVPLQQPDP